MEYASRKIRKPAPYADCRIGKRKSLPTRRSMRVEKQESSRHMPIAELGKEKVFPLGGNNYKYKKLNWEKVSALPTEEVIAFPFWEGVGLADVRGLCLPLRWGCRHCRRKRTMRQNVSPLGGAYLSFELNWEECRRREILLSFKIQNGKEGLS